LLAISIAKIALIGINKNIFSHFPIDHNGAIWDKLIRVDFSKKTKLQKDILCFLEDGMIRKYHLVEDSEESCVSVDFYFTGDIFTAKGNTEFEQQFVYEPISKGILWYLDMEEVRKMFFESALCSATQKVFMEQQLHHKTMREIQLLKKSPREMYFYLLENKPKFVQSVPLKYLASYIGITPQALSRIRGKIT
jgi:CRP-like cAMP-binding protein